MTSDQRKVKERRIQMLMRIHPEERAEWQAEADRLGIGLTTWVRMVCNDAARGVRP